MSRTIGTSLLVAGTTIGGGMLALPMTGISIGIFTSIAILVGMWVLMYYASLITLEINTYFKDALSINSIVEKLWGRKAYLATTICFLGLFYPLLAAYLMGCASLIQSFFVHFLGLKSISISIITLIVSFIFCLVIMKIQWADYYNRFLFLIKCSIFVGILVLLLPSLKMEQLVDIGEFDQIGLRIAIPIFFSSFCFHSSIPSIINYNSKNVIHCKSAFLLGSFFALVFYVLWVVISLGVVPLTGLHNFATTQQGDVGKFINILSIHSGAKGLQVFASLFSFLAISTSLIGVGVAMIDFFRERFVQETKFIRSIYSNLSVLVVPVLLTLFYPEGFLKALSFACISSCVIAILLPATIALYLRNSHEEIIYRAPGGKPILILTIILGLIVIAIEISNLLKL